MKNSLDGLLMVDGDVKQEVSGDTAVIVKKADLTVNFIKSLTHKCPRTWALAK